MKHLLLLVLTFTISACAQNKPNKTAEGQREAESELKAALTEKNEPNVINGKLLILKDEKTAISVAEPLLFSVYGKAQILSERPYKIYLVDHYWVIWGKLPQGFTGGTFLIIIDAKNAAVLKIIHWKRNQNSR